jgi:hypothetical protein
MPETFLTFDSGSCVDTAYAKRSVGQVSSSAESGPVGKAVVSALAAPLTCPGSDGTIFTANKQSFLVQCYQDHFGGDIGSAITSSLNACIALCTSTADCIDVSFVPTDYYHPGVGTCWMKSSLQSVQPNGAVWGAQLVASAATPLSTSRLPGALQTFGASKLQEACSCLLSATPLAGPLQLGSTTSTRVVVKTSIYKSTVILTSTVLPVSMVCYLST